MSKNGKNLQKIDMQNAKDQAVTFINESLKSISNVPKEGELKIYPHGITNIEFSVKFGGAEFSLTVSGPEYSKQG